MDENVSRTTVKRVVLECRMSGEGGGGAGSDDVAKEVKWYELKRARVGREGPSMNV